MRVRHFLSIAAMIAMASCEGRERVAGNGGEIGNGIAAGRVVRPDGRPAASAWVECIPLDQAPWEARREGWTTLTDSAGTFVCDDLPFEPVGVTVYDPASGDGHWHSDTARISAPLVMHVDTLAAPGSVRVALAPDAQGTLYLAGLSRLVAVEGRSDLLVADVPAGWSGDVLLARTSSEVVSCGTVGGVESGVTDSVGFSRTAIRLRIGLPGGLVAPVRNLPILVRLDGAWPGYPLSLDDGSDLRLSSGDGVALPLTIVRWDRAARAGVFWTFLDSVPVPGDSLELVLEQGLPARGGAPSPAFAQTGGWTAVWPLGDTGGTIADRLGRYQGTATGILSASGVAGAASRFDGRSSKVVFSGTAGADLVPEAGPYTMSCWAKLQMFTYSRFVMGYSDRGSALKYQGTTSVTPNQWLAQEFRSSPAGAFFTYGPADTAVWTHLAVTVDGDSLRLYVDGIRQAVAQSFDRSDEPKLLVDFALGTSLDSLGVGHYYFPGDLSEAWIHNVARSPDWIRFAAANQSPAAPAARLVR